MTFLDIKFIEHNNPRMPINIANSDGMIDLSPCIGIYQSATYFENYDMQKALDFAFDKNGFARKDLSNLSLDKQILYLVSLETHQNRYRNQVATPFISDTAKIALHNRLAENLSKNATVELDCATNLYGIKLAGRCDAISDNIIWELKFVNELKREHYLQLAMYLIVMRRKTGRLWNTRDNTLMEVSIKTGKEQEFLRQVAKTVRKNGGKTTMQSGYSYAQTTAINRYKKQAT
jgi:hypothetical protein